jgi:Bacterial Ig-like domain
MLINVASNLRSSRVATLLAIVMFAATSVGGAAHGRLVPPVAAADLSSDIPGIPMPGAVAAGRLGGAIYDVVYRLQVAPGYVIVASLTGTTGTDFDLYLFDSTATTVLSKTGLLAESIGPTSTESLSWPSRIGGTYYIDLNGSTNVEGDYRLAVQVVPDQTPPSATITLAGGRQSTDQLTVPVSIQASDDLSGVIELSLSSDGSTYTPWQSFQGSTTWTFAAGDGPKTLWAKVKNGVGIESAPTSDSITIDTVAPTVAGISPPRDSIVPGLRPRIAVTFDEEIAAASWLDLGLIMQSSGGALVPGSYTYDPVTRVGAFVPSNSLVPGAVYILTVGGVTDLAGNSVASSGSWTIIPTASTELHATVTPRVVLPGQSSTIDVTLSGAPDGSVVDIATLSPPGSRSPLATVTVTGGKASLTVTPTANTNYQFAYAGTAGVAPAQALATLLVRRTVLIPGHSSLVTASARVGRTTTIAATIGPPAAHVSVSFRLYRFDRLRRAWIYSGSLGRVTDATGQASLRWTPSTAGSYYWRVYVASTAEFANGVSPVYRWTVSR